MGFMPEPIVSVAQMRAREMRTWATGVTPESVIQRAGMAVAEAALRMTRPGAPVLVLAGHGHNGDDAEVASVHLKGLDVLVLRLTDPDGFARGLRWLREQLSLGRDILLEIDWQGAVQIKKLMPEAVGIFILPPSLETLAQRLAKRATDTPEVIERRLDAAKAEIRHVTDFDYVILNNDFEEAARDLIAVVRAERLRLTTQLVRHHDLINRMK